MGIIIWLIVGGICGWLASLIMRTDAQQGIILNIIVGIVGAVTLLSLLGALTPILVARGVELLHSPQAETNLLIVALVGTVIALGVFTWALNWAPRMVIVT